MKEAEDDGDEHQRRNGREDKAADDGAAERRILFATLAKAERHRQHADDHRKRRHQHRPEACPAGIERRRRGIVALRQLFPRAKLMSRMLFAVATPMHMIVPIRAGTLKVV